MKILIAEDDYVSSIYLYKIFESYGHCDTATDGIEAMAKFYNGLDDNKPYDLVLLDIMMPRFDGLRILKAMRDMEKKRKKRSKIIIVSALNDNATISDAVKLGCDGFLNKPVTRMQLMKIIDNMENINTI